MANGNKMINLSEALGNVAATKNRKKGKSNRSAEDWFEHLLGNAYSKLYPSVNFTWYHKTDQPSLWIVAWNAIRDPTQPADTPVEDRLYVPTYDMVKTTLGVMRPPNPIFSDDPDFLAPSPHVIRIHPMPIPEDEVPQIGSGLDMSQKERVAAIEKALTDTFNGTPFKVAPVKTTEANIDIISVHWHNGPTEATVKETLDQYQDGVVKITTLIRTLDKNTIQAEVTKLYMAREIARAAGKLKPEDEEIDVVTQTLAKLNSGV